MGGRGRSQATQSAVPVPEPAKVRGLVEPVDESLNNPSMLPVTTVGRSLRPAHPGRVRRILSTLQPALGFLADPLDRLGTNLVKVANTLRFETFWRTKVVDDPRAVVTPTFNKTLGKKPIWNVALNMLREQGADTGTVLEFGTNNGGWLKYFVDQSPETVSFVGFDCFEGLPESWDGLPAGAIKGYGAPVELWADHPDARAEIVANAERGIPFPAPPQPNVRIMSGLFSDALTRYLADGWPSDLRLVHFDADLYISTRPVLDTLCGALKHRYLILFDEFYSVNHEFRAWNEFATLFALTDWRVVAASADGSQVLIEVNTRAEHPGKS